MKSISKRLSQSLFVLCGVAFLNSASWATDRIKSSTCWLHIIDADNYNVLTEAIKDKQRLIERKGYVLASTLFWTDYANLMENNIYGSRHGGGVMVSRDDLVLSMGSFDFEYKGRSGMTKLGFVKKFQRWIGRAKDVTLEQLKQVTPNHLLAKKQIFSESFTELEFINDKDRVARNADEYVFHYTHLDSPSTQKTILYMIADQIIEKLPTCELVAGNSKPTKDKNEELAPPSDI